jgi:hypothetical protein
VRPAAKSADAAGSAAPQKVANAAGSKTRDNSKPADKSNDTSKVDAKVKDTTKPAGKGGESKKADGKAKDGKKAADPARVAKQTQARSSIAAQMKIMAANRAANRPVLANIGAMAMTNAGAFAAGNAAAVAAAKLNTAALNPARGNLPIGSVGSNALLVVPALCDGKCSPSDANVALAVQVQAQAAGSQMGVPGDSMSESFHELPWRSNSGISNATRSRAVSDYAENLETVNFMNMVNIFMVP